MTRKHKQQENPEYVVSYHRCDCMRVSAVRTASRNRIQNLGKKKRGIK